MKNNTIDNLFLLLKSALWQDGQSAKAMTDVDWRELYELAKEQCLVGVMADAFKYFTGATIGGEEKLRWLAYVIQLERRNQRMNALIGRLFDDYQRHGLTPVLLKGQAFAANYPYPLHRQCGDIDVYFKRREDCRVAVEWASRIDTAAAESAENGRDYKHFAFSLAGDVVELHYFMCVFGNRRLQQRLQTIIDKEFADDAPCYVEIGGERIETVPSTLSVLHQLMHISHHLLEAGIGLRQICDLALFLDEHDGEIDRSRLNGYLKDLELTEVAQSLGCIMVHQLGLRAEKLPFGMSDRYAHFILNEIFEGGNFGKKKTEYRNGANVFLRKLQSIFYFYKRCRLYKSLLPSEAKSYFINKIKLNVRLLTKHHYCIL